jgi:hypothetical protein
LNEKTVWNIGADLVMLGLADRDGTSFKLGKNLKTNDEDILLNILRDKLGKHSLKLALFKKYPGKTISPAAIRGTFKECIPKAKFGEKTWTTYANRLTNYLIYSGYLIRAGSELVVQDSGSAILDRDGLARRGKQRGKVFSVSVSPFAALTALNKIPQVGCKMICVKRNELAVLKRFELVFVKNGEIYLNHVSISKSGGNKEAIWAAAKNESSLLRCIEIIRDNPEISWRELAGNISEEYSLNWSDGSRIRYGNILKQWSKWIKEGMDLVEIPLPPGRPVKS